MPWTTDQRDPKGREGGLVHRGTPVTHMHSALSLLPLPFWGPPWFPWSLGALLYAPMSVPLLPIPVFLVSTLAGSQAAKLPMSIIIIGVGQAEFDGEFVPLHRVLLSHRLQTLGTTLPKE